MMCRVWLALMFCVVAFNDKCCLKTVIDFASKYFRWICCCAWCGMSSSTCVLHNEDDCPASAAMRCDKSCMSDTDAAWHRRRKAPFCASAVRIGSLVFSWRQILGVTGCSSFHQRVNRRILMITHLDPYPNDFVMFRGKRGRV